MQKIQWFTAGGGGGGGTSYWTADGDNIYNNNSGNVGIGTASPLAKLGVVGIGSTSSTSAFLATNSVGSTLLSVKDDGRVGIQASSPTETLQIGTPASGSGQPDHHILLTGYDVAGIKWDMHNGWSKAELTSDLNGGINFINRGNVRKTTSFNIGSLYNGLPENEGSVAIRNSGASIPAITFGRNGPYLIATIKINGAGYANAPQGGLTFNVRQSPSITHDVLVLEKSGKVGIMTTTPTEALSVIGRIALNDGLSNLGVGDSALSGVTTGQFNTAVGVNAGRELVGGSHNTFIGYNTNPVNGNNDYNTLVGSGASQSSNSNRMVAVGYGAAVNGQGVTIGGGAGSTSGTASVSIGYQTNVLGGSDNVTIGVSAGSSIVGSQNVSIGRFTNRNVTGTQNTALGHSAAVGVSGSSVYDGVTAIGAYSLYSITTGGQNTAVGFESGYALTSGGGNTIFGYQAGKNITTSQFVTAIGYCAAYANQSNNTTAVGYQALQALTTGADNTAVGFQSGLLLSTGNKNTLLGQRAGASLTTGIDNVCIGVDIGASLSTGSRNVLIAGRSLSGDTTDAVRIGIDAGAASNSIAIGVQSNAYTTGVAIGRNSGAANSGSNAVGVGYSTQQADSGVAVGHSARAGAYSVSIGRRAGEGTTGATSNVIIGYWAGLESTGSRNVFIGLQSGRYETNSDRLYIENSNSTSPLIYGEFDNDFVRVNGSFEVTDAVSYQITDVTHSAASEYVVGSTEYIVFNTWTGVSGQAFIRLPLVADSEGRVLRFKSDGTINNSDYVTITPNASDTGVTIDGNASFDLDRDYDGIMLLCHNSNWFVIQRKSK